jgi:hypothetical protein
VEALGALDEQSGFAYRDGSVSVDGRHDRAEKVTAAARDEVLMGVGAHHRGDVVAAAHRPTLHVVGAVDCPQLGRRVGRSGIDQWAIGGDHALDGALVLESPQPLLQRADPVVGHGVSPSISSASARSAPSCAQ